MRNNGNNSGFSLIIGPPFVENAVLEIDTIRTRNDPKILPPRPEVIFHVLIQSLSLEYRINASNKSKAVQQKITAERLAAIRDTSVRAPIPRISIKTNGCDDFCRLPGTEIMLAMIKAVNEKRYVQEA
jgi:hypothetical protein